MIIGSISVSTGKFVQLRTQQYRTQYSCTTAVLHVRYSCTAVEISQEPRSHGELCDGDRDWFFRRSKFGGSSEIKVWESEIKV